MVDSLGRSAYEWQHSSSLRTIHIDRVNEILGLTSGSKLNMLTKDQLIKLVSSKEFAQVVPPSLYKMKPAPAPLPTSTSVVNTSANHSSNAAITGLLWALSNHKWISDEYQNDGKCIN